MVNTKYVETDNIKMSDRARRATGNPLDRILKRKALNLAGSKEVSDSVEDTEASFAPGEVDGSGAPSYQERQTSLRESPITGSSFEGIIIYHRGAPCLIHGDIIESLGASYYDLAEMTDSRDVLARLEGLAVGKLALDLDPFQMSDGQTAYALRARDLCGSGLVGDPFSSPSEGDCSGRWWNLGLSMSSKGGFPTSGRVQTAAIYGSTHPVNNYGKRGNNRQSTRTVRRDQPSI